MSGCDIHGFGAERERLNEIVARQADLTIERFFRLDGQAYEEGAFPRRSSRPSRSGSSSAGRS